MYQTISKSTGTRTLSEGGEAALDCDREAVAFDFRRSHLLARFVIQAKGLKRQLRGRSPKRFAQRKRNVHE
jgi:hypothetical protein